MNTQEFKNNSIISQAQEFLQSFLVLLIVGGMTAIIISYPTNATGQTLGSSNVIRRTAHGFH